MQQEIPVDVHYMYLYIAITTNMNIIGYIAMFKIH